jgi:hypothetical protein
VSAGRSRSRSLAELGAKWYLPQAAGDTAEDIITAVLSGHDKPRPKSRKARAERYHDKGLQARQTVYGDSSWQTAGQWYIDSRIGGGGKLSVANDAWDACGSRATPDLRPMQADPWRLGILVSSPILPWLS